MVEYIHYIIWHDGHVFPCHATTSLLRNFFVYPLVTLSVIFNFITKQSHYQSDNNISRETFQPINSLFILLMSVILFIELSPYFFLTLTMSYGTVWSWKQGHMADKISIWGHMDHESYSWVHMYREISGWGHTFG